MAEPSPAFLQKRVSAGAALATLAAMFVFLVWRVAAIFDADLGAKGWLWLAFEAGFLVSVLPLVAVLYTVLGVALVHRGQAKRWQSALGGGAVGVLAGLALGSVGVFDIDAGGFLNSTLAGVAAMTVSGMAGGHVGRAGWFPPAGVEE